MDSSLSEIENTIDLDETEWMPSCDADSDDSVEITREVVTRRVTRNIKGSSATVCNKNDLRVQQNIDKFVPITNSSHPKEISCEQVYVTSQRQRKRVREASVDKCRKRVKVVAKSVEPSESITNLKSNHSIFSVNKILSSNDLEKSRDEDLFHLDKPFVPDKNNVDFVPLSSVSNLIKRNKTFRPARNVSRSKAKGTSVLDVITVHDDLDDDQVDASKVRGNNSGSSSKYSHSSDVIASLSSNSQICSTPIATISKIGHKRKQCSPCIETILDNEPLTDLTSSFEQSSFKLEFKNTGTALVKKAAKRTSLAAKVKRKSLLKNQPRSGSVIKKLSKVSKAVPFIDVETNALFSWEPAQVIAERHGVDADQARKVISLLDQECTLPFIARYRKGNTGNMQIEKLREVCNAYEQLKEVRRKVAKVICEDKSKNKVSSVTSDIKNRLLQATTLQEVKALTAHTVVSKGSKTYADRARALGLGDAAVALLQNHNVAQSSSYANQLIDVKVKGRASLLEVEQGLKYIIADVISKDLTLVTFMKSRLKQSMVLLKSSKARKLNTKEETVQKVAKDSRKNKIRLKDKESVKSVASKFEQYFNYGICAWRAQPHIVCALNRGEQLGVLSVKVVLPPESYNSFIQHCKSHWLRCLQRSSDGSWQAPYRHQLIDATLPDCWDRLLSPSLQTWVRHELSDVAELASVEVFTKNLRQLLLTPPVKAKLVLAIDPGFNSGCKVALVEKKGKILAVDTLYLFGAGQETDRSVQRLKELIVDNGCEIIAIGNGTACRQTEEFISGLIARGVFESVNVQYTIVNEAGASQYSVTPEARQEFPHMDVTHISAVSLARRLQDPLLEYVKVPPMHLGIGMYQHDVASKLLKSSLDSVIMECVSFVGVDLNVASEIILKKVSGLNRARAAEIVRYREENGPFRRREELKKVKGIGPKSFQQCAGFVRIVPQTVRQSSRLTPLCPLDATTVHPESYEVANTLIGLSGLSLENIGSLNFRTALGRFLCSIPRKELSEKCHCSEDTLETIVESLNQPLDFDFRGQFSQPLFRKGITQLHQLKIGDRLTGTVRNVTTFGAFVDVGVAEDGLIHSKNMNSCSVQLGNTVLVSVQSVDVNRKRLGLSLVHVLD